MQEEMQEKLDKMEVMRKEMTSMLGKDVGQMGEMRMKVDGLEMKVDGLEKEVVDLKGELAQVNAEKAEHSGRCDARMDKINHDFHKLRREIGDRRTSTRNNTNTDDRRRTQAGATCDSASLTARTDEAMDACCPSGSSGGGHRILQASCELPDTCPSAECAAIFMPYFEDCDALLSTMPGVPVEQFRAFYSSCQEMQSSSQLMLQPVAVQMFRVLVNTEGAAHAGSMFPGGGDGNDGSGGYGQPLDPLQPVTPVPPPPDAT